jgi:uncharacterized protein (DUF433 family)
MPAFETMNGNGETAGYRYITRQPGVRGGHAIIEGACVGVHDVMGLLQNGDTCALITCNRDYFPAAAGEPDFKDNISFA